MFSVINFVRHGEDSQGNLFHCHLNSCKAFGCRVSERDQDIYPSPLISS